MLKYAQADTHYLLYVYDRVRADLYDMGNSQATLIQQVWEKSRALSLKVWTGFFTPAHQTPQMHRKYKTMRLFCCCNLFESIQLNQFKKPAHYVSNEVLNIFISISSFSIEICEAYFYGGLVHGAVPQAEEELQHPAAGGFQTAVRLER